MTTDDFLIDNPQYRPWRPKVGFAPRLGDAELVTLVVVQALLGFTSEARWLRYRRHRKGSATPPRAHRSDLAQRPHQSPILRPLTAYDH
ncbi:putative transposase [Mycobacterium kansasii 732]|nr:hypothetical protein [Mycobacterium pseudokansasii]EUA08091.1 putative transposase [Mycobacterium kansasii 732]MBY0386592.1 hypothetical protein [Mycobacterium pseudokansasii]